MLLSIHPDNPSPKLIAKVVECLKNGGIIIYPTDTVYGMGCDIFQMKAVEKIARMKGIDPAKSHFSFICHDLSHITDYTRPFSTQVYKLMKRALPGPYTFILEANNEIPKRFISKRKTVGIRVPDNDIIREIVRELGNPIMSTSIYDEDEIIEYSTDPSLIHEKFEAQVDIVIDGGYGDNVASTVIDCTSDDFVVIREGKGSLDIL
jgi:tRNA threonylcarbamoyl adenosine modification protein (Sua5/YciO/YrdC/YwlC family)